MTLGQNGLQRSSVSHQLSVKMQGKIIMQCSVEATFFVTPCIIIIIIIIIIIK